MSKKNKNNKDKKIKDNVDSINNATTMDELSNMLNDLASVLKAITMLNKTDNAALTVVSFDEQVVLPESVRLDVIEVLKRHVETVKPFLSVLAKSL